jgi:plastocyanin
MAGRKGPSARVFPDRTDDNEGMHPFRVRFLAVIALVALALTLSACGGDDAQVAAPAGTVRMGDFWFQPADVTMSADSELTVVNDGAVIHNWIIRGAGVGTAELKPGQSIIVSLRGVEPGTYTVYCDQPGHVEAGQVGTLTIT